MTRQRPTQACLVLRFPSTADSVRNALCRVRAHLGDRRARIEQHDTAELALAELLNNIVEHAYGDNRTGIIELRATLDQDRLGVEVRDRGVPMPGNSLPQARMPDASGPLDALPEGGFGWGLLHAVTENLHYSRLGCTNITRFTIPLVSA